MTKSPILVVGAGPAGLRASIELARAGQRVVLVDQAPGIGGAVYASARNPASDAPIPAEAQILRAGLAEQADRIDIRCATAFAGIDYTGAALLTGEGGEL
jgi:heterodisulfide reductase subunit A-like polyferredoxin